VRTTVSSRSIPSAASGLSFLVFNLLCAPCFAAIGAIKQEMHSGKWTLFAVGYQTAFAYCVALIINQLGSAFVGNVNIFGTTTAVLIMALAAFMMLRPYKESQNLK